MSLNSGCRERSLLFKGHFGILTWSDSGRCGWCVRVGVVVIVAALCILLTSLCCSLLLVSRFRPLFLPLLSLHLISIYFPPYHIFFFSSSSLCLSESSWLSSRYQQTDRQTGWHRGRGLEFFLWVSFGCLDCCLSFWSAGTERQNWKWRIKESEMRAAGEISLINV